MAERRLLVVHAHPDDECLSTGGILARYSAAGAHVCLVTCTNGEVGEIAELPELGDPEALRHRLGEVRVEELRESCRRLGVEDLRLLGYHDSGMEGTPENEDPAAFVNQDFGEVVGRLAKVIRELRPQVAVTYNEKGFYGHPDHVRAHEALVAAVPAAADPARYPEMAEPWQVSKVYFTAVPTSRFRAARELFSDEEERRFSDEDIERIGTDDELVTTHVDVASFVKHKFHAIEAHRTQLGTTQWWLSMPENIREMAMGTESFVLAFSALPRPEGMEQDLFEGVTA